MANFQHHHKLPPHAQRYLVTGVLTVIPIWITWLVFDFVLRQLTRIGLPWARAISGAIHDDLPILSDLLLWPWFQNLLAALLTLTGLYLLGWAATKVVGRRLITGFENLMGRVPVVQTIYGSTRKLVQSLQQKPNQFQRVVLIEFPTPGMKTVGFVTHILRDQVTGEELAAVYVPTAPNPTSGYLEILPLHRIMALDWSVDEAMTFIQNHRAPRPDLRQGSVARAHPLRPEWWVAGQGGRGGWVSKDITTASHPTGVGAPTCARPLKPARLPA